jgi:hypothetical protein
LKIRHVIHEKWKTKRSSKWLIRRKIIRKKENHIEGNEETNKLIISMKRRRGR